METIELFGLTIYPYGLAVAAAGALALIFAALMIRREHLPDTTASWVAVLSVPLGLLCGHLAYCLVSLDWALQEGFGFFFRFSEGYLLYGAMAGCVLAVLLAAKLTQAPFLRLLDSLCAPAMLMIALCRLAEGLVGNGYGCGWPVEEWFMEGNGMSLFALDDPSFFCRLPFAAQDFYEGWNWAVFVLEAIGAAVIMVIALRVNGKRPGGRTALTLLLYASTQVLFESLRQDAVLRWGFVRVNQIIGAVLITGLLLLCIRLSGVKQRKSIIISDALLVIGMLLVVAMEFALEGKISAIEWMPMDVCYAIMACGCGMMIASVLRFWEPAFRGA